MNELSQVAPAFVEMAHHIVWCGAATVDVKGRPRSRILCVRRHSAGPMAVEGFPGQRAQRPRRRDAHLARVTRAKANTSAPSA